jgi:hypothetical protein
MWKTPFYLDLFKNPRLRNMDMKNNQPLQLAGNAISYNNHLEERQDVLVGLLGLVVIRRRGGARQIKARKPIHQIASSATIRTTR